MNSTYLKILLDIHKKISEKSIRQDIQYKDILAIIGFCYRYKKPLRKEIVKELINYGLLKKENSRKIIIIPIEKSNLSEYEEEGKWFK